VEAKIQMNNEESKTLTFQSSRFGEFSVASEAVIYFTGGVIGFPKEERFVLLEHKPPFSWIHSIDNQDLAFVVVDGNAFGEGYSIPLPIGDPRLDLTETDEFAILVLVTVRPGPSLTTANLKAPLIVNLRNRKGVQIVIDDSRFSTRFPLWEEDSKKEPEKK